MSRKDIMPKEPRSMEGRRPHLSRKRIAGSVKATLIIYWMEDVRSSLPIPAPSMI